MAKDKNKKQNERWRKSEEMPNRLKEKRGKGI